MSDSSLPRRWRFSLRTLLGWTVILALGITVWMQWWELSRLRDEVRLRRDEGGHLDIEDEALVHGTGIEMAKDEHWRWRIYIPATGRYQLCWKESEIPADGLPAGKIPPMVFPLEPGEHRIDLQIEIDNGGLRRHVAYLSTPEGRLGMMELVQSAQWWLDPPLEHRDRSAEAQALGRGTSAFKLGEPAVLLRYRAQEVVTEVDREGKANQHNTRTIATPSDGLMLWIERTP